MDLVKYLTMAYADSQLHVVLRDFPDLLEMVTPAIRADLTALDKYVWRSSGFLLNCGIKMFYGSEEKFPEEYIKGWEIHTNFKNEFSTQTFKGGHFYLNDPKPLLEVLNLEMTQFWKLFQESF